MSRFQKFATAALVSVIALIFVGAIVRVTGAGLGCPDWPKCWGCLIPPTKAEDIDVSKIDFEKFERKAARLGRDPSTVTPEHILESFNPVHTWTEFVNRLFSLPVGFFSMAVLVSAFLGQRKRPLVVAAALASVILVGVNAWLGAQVVFSGLKPGVLTAHMAMAMALLALLTYVAWRGTDRPWTMPGNDALRRSVRVAVGLLFGLLLVEGLLGTQIREMTDEMAKFHRDSPREEWIGELEGSWIYLSHRSFSWAILAATIWAWRRTKRAGPPGRTAKLVLGIVLLQMVLGVVMSQVKIFAWVQVLHVGLSGTLVAAVTLWLCGTFAAASDTE